MPEVKVRKLSSEFGIAFTGDQSVAGVPSFGSLGEEFAKKLNLSQLGVGDQAGQTVWFGIKGLLPGKAPIRIEALRGNELLLFVTVDGNTATARDALQRVWQVALEVARNAYPGVYDDPTLEKVEALGKPFVSTIAIVELPATFEQIFPNIGILYKTALSGLQKRGLLVQPPAYHVSVDLATSVGAGPTTFKLQIEPRLNSDLGDRVFWSQSPLSSDEHLDMLEAIAK